MAKKIYPTSHKKYVGSSIRKKGEHFVARVRTGYQIGKRSYERNFETYEKALRFVKKKSKKHNLRIRNIIYDRGDHFECELTRNQMMKFDKEDIDKVQSHIIYAYKSSSGLRYYAGTSIKNKKHCHFANVIMGHLDNKDKSITVDHIDHTKACDNRKSNLRLATKSKQAINRGTQKSNKSGEKGVSFHQDKKSGGYYTFRWVAQWSISEYQRGKRSFSCCKHGYHTAKAMAIEYREKMVAESDHYKL